MMLTRLLRFRMSLRTIVISHSKGGRNEHASKQVLLDEIDTLLKKDIHDDDDDDYGDGHGPASVSRMSYMYLPCFISGDHSIDPHYDFPTSMFTDKK